MKVAADQMKNMGNKKVSREKLSRAREKEELGLAFGREGLSEKEKMEKLLWKVEKERDEQA